MVSPVVAGGSRSRRPAHSLLLVALAFVVVTAAGKASAATFLVTNLCPFTVWQAAIPAGGGTQLEPGHTRLFKVPAGTAGGRIWGRTGCRFGASGHGWCASGDCTGALHCQLSGKPPATLAEFTIGGSGGTAADYYHISVVDGFNMLMDFTCDSFGLPMAPSTIRSRELGCPDANQRPNEGKVRRCKANSHVVFCQK